MKRGTERAARLLVTFTAATAAILTMAAPAAAVPPVDPYQPYVNPGCLSFVEQPGVRAFRDMIMSRVGGTNGGIHACSGYEHGEGRAWDWMRLASVPTQAQQVQLVLNWLLATDSAGNPHAMARRLGIGYIIWNRQVITLWSGTSNKTWHSYSGSNPHTDHVHFAFSWAGARQQTTWFTTAPRPGDWYPGGVATPAASLPANRSYGWTSEQHYFDRGPDGSLRHWYWTPGTGVVTQNWGGSLVGKPVAYPFHDGSHHVFARGTDGKLKHWYWSPVMGTQIGLQDWGGDAAGDPTGFSDGANQHVFARGSDGRLKHWYWAPGMSANGYQDWGGSLAGTPVAYPFHDGSQHVFGRGTDGKLKHWYWAPGMTTIGFQDWGGDAAGDPAGFSDGPNQHAFAKGSDGKLKHWYWAPGMSANGYQDWGGQVG